MTRSAWPTVALAACLAAGAVLGAPTDPDPSFGAAGFVPVHNAVVRSGALHYDGGLLVAVADLAWTPPAPRGSRVLKLDAAGAWNPTFAPIPPVPALTGETGVHVVSVSAMVDGSFTVLHHADRPVAPAASTCASTHVTRHRSHGSRDTAYGSAGVTMVAPGGCNGPDHTTGGTGVSYVPFHGATALAESTSIVRVGASGREVATLDSHVVMGSAPPLPYVHGKVALAPDGLPVAVANVPARNGLGVVWIMGLPPDPYEGPAVSLGYGWLGLVHTNGDAFGYDLAVMPDGRVLIGGYVVQGGLLHLGVARLLADGRADPSFGTGGLALLPVARSADLVTDVRIAMQADGRIVAAATVLTPAGGQTDAPRIVLARLARNGLPDESFAPGGLFALDARYGTSLAFLTLRPDGRIVVGTNAGVVQLRGGDLGTPHPWRERHAVEYFDERSGHYFVTASEVEIALLDTTPPPTWTRTGQAFNVYDEATAPLSPVCRFWSDQSFAPKSSHFYTPYAQECELLQQGSVWRYEGIVFQLRLPEGMPGSKACPAGTQPLYRAYNNNLSGAPNHRYMIDPALLDGMIGQGWTMEGEALTRVFACVPLQQ